jgi:hypothetical protein
MCSYTALPVGLGQCGSNLSKKNAEARRRVTAMLGYSNLLVEIFFDEQVKNAMRELWVRRKLKEWFVFFFFDSIKFPLISG